MAVAATATTLSVTNFGTIKATANATGTATTYYAYAEAYATAVHQYGDATVNTIDLYNDGSLPDIDEDRLLIAAGGPGEIVNVGHHEETDTPLYLVDFGLVVLGVTEEEIEVVR